ncbi:unnamed protein product, partial [Coregonus sp. 'balchen']
FQGTRCEIDTDECISGPCQNQGHSVTVSLGFLADTVRKTSMNVPPAPAKMEAFAKTWFHCNCPPGYFGSLCDLDINECEVSPCLHEAVCINKPGGFKCVCPPGYA